MVIDYSVLDNTHQVGLDPECVYARRTLLRFDHGEASLPHTQRADDWASCIVTCLASTQKFEASIQVICISVRVLSALPNSD
jgi:hypothetical protein